MNGDVGGLTHLHKRIKLDNFYHHNPESLRALCPFCLIVDLVFISSEKYRFQFLPFVRHEREIRKVKF